MSIATASKTLELSDWDGIRAKVEKCSSRYGRARLGNNLYAYRHYDEYENPGTGFIRIALHGSDIVRIYDTGAVMFNFANWPTRTTTEAIAGVLARAKVEIANSHPLYPHKSAMITFGGNYWLGGVGRPRRQNQPLSIDIYVRNEHTQGYHGELVDTIYEGEMGQWWTASEFVPNWKELVK